MQLTRGSSLQETFDAGLQAFQQEGIANITALKDQLLAAKHIQSKAIEARHASLMKRWTQLLANSATRKKKLLEAQSHFRKVRVINIQPDPWERQEGPICFCHAVPSFCEEVTSAQSLDSVEMEAHGALEPVLVNLSFDPPRISTVCTERHQTEDKWGRF